MGKISYSTDANTDSISAYQSTSLSFLSPIAMEIFMEKKPHIIQIGDMT